MKDSLLTSDFKEKGGDSTSPPQTNVKGSVLTSSSDVYLQNNVNDSLSKTPSSSLGCLVAYDGSSSSSSSSGNEDGID